MDYLNDQNLTQYLIENLTSYVSEERLQTIHEVSSQRTRHLTLVLEDIYQSHNASAVIRSSECFGVQDIHMIENRNSYEKHRTVDMGSSRWIDLHRYQKPDQDNTTSCLKSLKQQGYQIVATCLDETSIPIEEVDMNQKTALLFGTEETGLTSTALELSDVKIKLPLFGFTQSFNISVCAALCLYSLTQKMRSSKINWELNSFERNQLILKWMIKSIKAGDQLVDHYLKKIHDKN